MFLIFDHGECNHSSWSISFSSQRKNSRIVIFLASHDYIFVKKQYLCIKIKRFKQNVKQTKP